MKNHTSCTGNVLMMSIGGNPAMDMLYSGLRELNCTVIEYPVIGYRHDSGLTLSASGFPVENQLNFTAILKLCKSNYFDLLCTDLYSASVSDEVAEIIEVCRCKFVIIDQTGVNGYCDKNFWNSHPYRGRIPDKRFVRVKPRIGTPEEQETMLMSTRLNWRGPQLGNLEFLSVFIGITYQGFQDAYYRRLLVHDTFEHFPGTFFSRVQKFYNEDYFNLLAKSLTAISVKGMEWDCWRFWEILQVGSCLITEDTTQIIDYEPPFVEEEHFLIFRFNFDYLSFDPSHVASELFNLLSFVSQNKTSVEQIAFQGHEFALAHHSSVNRARQLLKVLG